MFDLETTQSLFQDLDETITELKAQLAEATAEEIIELHSQGIQITGKGTDTESGEIPYIMIQDANGFLIIKGDDVE